MHVAAARSVPVQLDLAVMNLVAEELARPLADVRLTSRLADDLGADSLDSYNLAMRLEETFGVAMPDGALGDLQTVGDLVRYLEPRLASAAGRS